MTTATPTEQIERLAAMPDQSQVADGESAGDLAFSIRVLQNHYCNVIERQEQAETIDAMADDIELLKHQLSESATGMEALIKQRDGFEAECKKMLNLYTGEKGKTGATILKLERMNQAQAVELKTLRSLNPQRLMKQIKELQKKAAAQTEANAAQRDTIKDLKARSKDYKVVAEANIKLRHDNQMLSASLDIAAKDITDGNRVVPLHEIGDWAIYPDEKDGQLIVVDKTTDVARPFTRDLQLIKARPVPAKVLKQCGTVLDQMAQIREQITDYSQQEAV